MTGAVDLPAVFTENRVSVRSKPVMLRGSKSTEFVVPRLNVLYYNNSFFPRSCGSVQQTQWKCEVNVSTSFLKSYVESCITVLLFVL
jgi:hypothetical protein